MTETWWIEPRDPLVFHGFQRPGQSASPPKVLPPQSTLVGMVRSVFAQSQGRVSPTAALELLKIGIRGPLLWQAPRVGSFAGTFWASAPLDCLLESDGKTLVGANVVSLGADQGMLWPTGMPDSLTHCFYMDLKNNVGAKRSPLHGAKRFWPWETLVDWALEKRDVTPDLLADDQSFAREDREHVVIHDDTFTAEPGGLFTNPGYRYPDGFGLVVEVNAGNQKRPEGTRWVTLGGEARLSALRNGDMKFPEFPAEKYRAAITQNPGAWLRLQLLTPGLFSQEKKGCAWLPTWVGPDGHGSLPQCSGAKLRLRAVLIPGFEATSGWNLQRVKQDKTKDGAPLGSAGGPRGVRRLVPAGSVYVFEPLGTGIDPLLKICGQLWLKPIETVVENTPFPDDFRTTPDQDGYGLLLPGLCTPTTLT